MEPFIVKGLLVHLGGQYKVRTFWEEDMEIPIYDLPYNKALRHAEPNLSGCQSGSWGCFGGGN